MARTPPRRPEDIRSQESSPLESTPSIQVSRARQPEPSTQDPDEEESEMTPITWPSRAENASKQSPMISAGYINEKQPQTTSNRELHSRDNLRQQKQASPEQQKQAILQQQSPTLLVPRQIRSPPKSAAAASASQLSGALGTPKQPSPAGVGMPQIAIPPGINGDPH